MKRHLLSFIGSLATLTALHAQTVITITAADMPVAGDELTYSVADPATATLNLSNTGSNISWDYSSMVSIYQASDVYKTAAQVNATYGLTISPTAYGYKVADSLPGAPIPVKQIYNFFNKKSSPSRFVIEGFGALISGTPIPINYSDEDEVYYFPLTVPHTQDSSGFKLSYSLSGLGSFSQQGYRKTTVDGWGTIKTPYTTTPIQVIRVRSQIVEIDSFSYAGMKQGIARNTVEYKWLANGQHYPMLIVTANVTGTSETPTSVRYRDTKRGTGVLSPSAAIEVLQVYPNPASGNEVTIKIPASWTHYTLNVYDAAGKLVAQTANAPKINTGALPAGKYMIVADGGIAMGIAQFVK